MAAKRVINGVHVVPMGFANAFLIESDDGLTLIDAGYPNKEAAVFEAIRGLGRSPDQLKDLVFSRNAREYGPRGPGDFDRPPCGLFRYSARCSAGACRSTNKTGDRTGFEGTRTFSARRICFRP